MNKVVLISGGAKGIGKAIALELGKQGYDIVINYLTSESEAHALKDDIIKNYGVRCLAIQADVSKEDEVDKMVSLIESELGGVDILINNAAIDLSNLFHLKNADEFRKTLDVNVVGAFNCSKRVYRHMLDQEYGRIINIELDGYDEEFLKEEVEKIMVNRYGDPKEVAYLVKFLVSNEADFINNTVIRIDGGQKGSC